MEWLLMCFLAGIVVGAIGTIAFDHNYRKYQREAFSELLREYNKLKKGGR